MVTHVKQTWVFLWSPANVYRCDPNAAARGLLCLSLDSMAVGRGMMFDFDLLKTDNRPGVINSIPERSHFAAVSIADLPQITETERQYLAAQNKPTRLIEIKVHEYGALVRRRKMKGTRDKRKDERQRHDG